ncbi:hypothetical protein OG949_35220 [Streptomyces scopuliridis]|nr:hypothetical protein [Streptomyces scopuliridis]WSB37561.1 hypothetical protein OG949_35220 [Streptomyces scopuliridis]
MRISAELGIWNLHPSGFKKLGFPSSADLQPGIYERPMSDSGSGASAPSQDTKMVNVRRVVKAGALDQGESIHAGSGSR